MFYRLIKVAIGVALVLSIGLNILLLERNKELYNKVVTLEAKEDVVCDLTNKRQVEEYKKSNNSLLELQKQMQDEIDSLNKQVLEVSKERDLRQHLIDKLNGAPFAESDGTWKVMSFWYNNKTYDDFELTIDDPMDKYKKD